MKRVLKFDVLRKFCKKKKKCFKSKKNYKRILKNPIFLK